ncbi:MAG: histidine phosphatase family protein [Patescibacteria group bacterium]
MSRLILVRHGQSKWNLSNRFTGQIDVSISNHGVGQCLYLGEKVKSIPLDCAFSSCLNRSKETLSIILSQTERSGVYIDESLGGLRAEKTKKYVSRLTDIPIYTNCLLNERHYGLLEGMDKNEAREKYGEKKVFAWRRSFLAKPPRGESLEDVFHRTIPFFKKRIIPLLQEGKNVIVSAHGNSLRAIIKYIENISEEKISFLEIYTGQMIVYHYEDERFVSKLEKLSFKRPITWEKWGKIFRPRSVINGEEGE